MSHRTRTSLAVALQLLILAAIAGARQWALVTGTTVLLETAPGDPRDLFRGDYVVLTYKISTLKPAALGSGEDFRPGQLIYVGLERHGKYWEAVSISRKPANGIYLRGRVGHSPTGALRVSYGIESYFLPEGTGRQLESSRGLLSVEVAIGRDGTAVIRKLYIADIPFP